jgi:hypothetical protein
MSDIALLRGHLEKLLNTQSEDGAFLIVTLCSSDDFLQLTGDSRGVQLDFPLVTARQISFESAIKQVAAREGLQLIENKGEDGARYLDMDMPMDVTETTRIVSVFLRDVFRVNERTMLEYECEGFE